MSCLPRQKGRKIEAVIEVETVESVNNLEALAEWVPFARLRSAFHLYVPAAMADVAKRLCTDFNVPVAEINSYHWIGDEMRFLAVFKAPAAKGSASSKPVRQASAPKTSAPKKKAPKPAKRANSKAAKSGSRTGRLVQAQIAVPFLKFGRDRRGYETTALVHAIRGQGQVAAQGALLVSHASTE